MSDAFVGEIRIFAGNFAPTGWAFCAGQLLPISQNTALFSLLGTMYGGDGKSNFALPNLQDQVPIMWGQGAGLSLVDIGQVEGSAAVALNVNQVPSHSHLLGCNDANGGKHDPTANVPAAEVSQVTTPYRNNNLDSQMGGSIIGGVGGGQPHNNMQPYLVMSYIIAMQGIFPPRS